MRLLNCTILILAFSIVALGCSSPFNFDYGDSKDDQIVIQGYLSNMEDRDHYIRINRTISLNGNSLSEDEYVTDASVYIKDDLGNSLVLTYYKDGLYKTDSTAKAEPSRLYKLIVELTDGSVYESSYQSLTSEAQRPASIDYRYDVVERVEDNRILKDSLVVVSAEVVKNQTNSFFRWDINHYFIIDADEYRDPRTGTIPNIKDEINRSGQRFRHCFVKDYPPKSLAIHSDVLTGGTAVGETYNIEIHTVPLTGNFEYEFVIEAYQLSLSLEAYEYWKQLDEINQNTGGVFDVSPTPVYGNIHKVSERGNGQKPALGYFGVYAATVDRVFIDLNDLGVTNNDFYNDVCVINYKSLEIRTIGRYFHRCWDCRRDKGYFQNYENNPPAWWKEKYQ